MFDFKLRLLSQVPLLDDFVQTAGALLHLDAAVHESGGVGLLEVVLDALSGGVST